MVPVRNVRFSQTIQLPDMRRTEQTQVSEDRFDITWLPAVQAVRVMGEGAVIIVPLANVVFMCLK